MSLYAETERICLRPLAAADAAKTDDDAIKTAVARREEPSYAFAVVKKANGAVIGTVTVAGEALSLYITEKEHNRGYGAAALSLSFDLLFGCAGVVALCFCCEADNLYAVKTALRAGMEPEKAKNGCFSARLSAGAWELL